MIVARNVPLLRIIRWTWRWVAALLIWSTLAVWIYQFSGLVDWLKIPWLPISLVGTAVAFYVGFKNNSSYDRMWEARKIWGAIVNSSRSWGICVRSFVSDQFVDGSSYSEDDIAAIHRRLINRHIAWLYCLRSQLLMIKQWEHPGQTGGVGRRANYYRNKLGAGKLDHEETIIELKDLLSAEELARAMKCKNAATQLIDAQSMDLRGLRADTLIDDFRHMEMQKVLGDFYDHQGKAERIKNFPLPRQYANSSSILVFIFLALLPFGMASEFMQLGKECIWWSIPFTALVGWVFTLMESIGDYSENPFQGLSHDIPMLSLCRTIEIDLLEMLGETDLPQPIKEKDDVLM